MKQKSPEVPPYIDLPQINETFADQVRLIHWDGQSARIELGVSRPHLAGPNHAEVTTYTAARLVLTPGALVSLHDQLLGLLKQLEHDGTLKRIALAPARQQ